MNNRLLGLRYEELHYYQIKKKIIKIYDCAQNKIRKKVNWSVPKSDSQDTVEKY